jgi:hypothetical protein
MSALRVFISYAADDAPLVKKLTTELEHRGVEVTYPFEGSGPAHKAAEALLVNCDAAVCVVTGSATASPWVKQEWEAALSTSWDKPLRLIPIVQEGAAPPGLFRDRAWIDLSNAPGEGDLRTVADRIVETLTTSEEPDAPYRAEAERTRRAELERMGTEIAPFVEAEVSRRGR